MDKENAVYTNDGILFSLINRRKSENVDDFEDITLRETNQVTEGPTAKIVKCTESQMLGAGKKEFLSKSIKSQSCKMNKFYHSCS